MEYKLSGSEFDFLFKGKGLEADVEYSLIYYPDSWPGNALICLGRATANDGGNVHIDGSVDTGDLTDAKIAFGILISWKISFEEKQLLISLSVFEKGR